MKIYSWNMLYRNRESEYALSFIRETDFDIFCLQEVPEDVLAELQALPLHVAFHIDTEKMFTSGAVPMYNVILSHHPISAQGTISFDEYQPLLPLRTRLFVKLMRPFHFAPTGNRGGLYADVTINEQLIRIFCLHLVLAHPAWRLEEFERAMLERDPSRATIVCGDFNILEKPHITPLNWLLGGRAHDTLLFNRERTGIEKRFVAHELINTLRGTITHPLSRSQLDHILVSHSFTISDARVLPDRHGSDHHPVCAEVVLEPSST